MLSSDLHMYAMTYPYIHAHTYTADTHTTTTTNNNNNIMKIPKNRTVYLFHESYLSHGYRPEGKQPALRRYL